MRTYFALMLMVSVTACSGKKDAEEETPEHVQTPVMVTTVKKYPMIEYIDLNATAQFLQKNYVKANITGYVERTDVHIGQYVTPGRLLFVLKTKEARAIGNAVNRLDPSFRFSGTNYIKASKSGYITEINHQPGDYVQDGEQLAVINDQGSFAFVMDMPYELRAYLDRQKNVVVQLPDGTALRGEVSQEMPVVDSTAQTQRIVIHVRAKQTIPENLIAKVRLVKADHSDSYSLPKAAVLTNDVQNEYWVMKMTDSITAVKTIVRKGMETEDRVEIISPTFSERDLILISGNFGLPDTAKVKITARK